jgi:predicted metal-binding protein
LSVPTDHFILICSVCNGTAKASDLQKALASRVPEGFAFKEVSCMAGCDHPATVGFQAKGKASYIFGDITDKQDLDALAQFARQYQQSQNGWTSAGQRPRTLYTKTLARLPALESVGD